MKKISEIKAELYEEDEFEEEYEIEKYSEADSIEEENEEYSQEYVDEEDEDDDYEEARKTFYRTDSNKLMKIFNIIFVIIIISLIFITIDVVCVAKYEKGPFFAIKTKTYNDGGTKVYYGIGYKVIKYNATKGRKDTQIGFWSLPYSITPTEIEDIDLAIEFQNNPEKTAEKYYKQYLKIESTIKSIDKEKNKIVLEYTDSDGKYTLQIKCEMASSKSELESHTEQKKMNIKGTVYKFSMKDDNKLNTVHMSDCFVE